MPSEVYAFEGFHNLSIHFSLLVRQVPDNGRNFAASNNKKQFDP